MSQFHENNLKNTHGVLRANGFTIPVVVLFVLTFMVIPLGFWLSTTKNNTGSVQGIESASSDNGTFIKIVSDSGSWDVFEYLCKSREECVKTLVAGKKLESVSGGKTEGSIIPLTYVESWKEYQYIKIFVKQGWGSTGGSTFEISAAQADGDSEIIELENTTVLLIPITKIQAAQRNLFVIKNSL